MEIFKAFGLDIKLLIANLVNFCLLVAILYKLGYKPILNFVKQRQEKIEKGIKDAEDAAEKLAQAAKKQEKITSDAHREAQEIIGKAKDQAKIQADSIIRKTNDEAKNIVERAKKEIALEKEKSLDQVREESVEAVVAVCEKLLRKKIDAKEDKKFIEDAIKHL